MKEPKSDKELYDEHVDLIKKEAQMRVLLDVLEQGLANNPNDVYGREKISVAVCQVYQKLKQQS